MVGGGRVGKTSRRIAAFGAFDEVGAQLGVVRSVGTRSLDPFRPLLVRLQHELAIAQSELATPPGAKLASRPAPKIEARHVERLEKEIDAVGGRFEPVHTFVLPGGTPSGAALHVARTVARRAERELWSLHETEPQRRELLEWANRLSDLLFVLALAVNRADDVHEIAPEYTV